MNGYKLSAGAQAALARSTMSRRGLTVVDNPQYTKSLVSHGTSVDDTQRPEMRMTISQSARTGGLPASFDSATIYAVPQPPPGTLRGGMVMDFAPAAIANLSNWALNGALHEGIVFLGYPYLAELAQRAEYRRIVEIWAEHATRRWVKLRGPDETKLGEIEQFLEDGLVKDGQVLGGLHARAIFREAAEHDGIFGRAHIHMDFDRPREVGSTLLVDPRKISPRTPVRRLKVIEPVWLYPGGYDAQNPLSDQFYKPSIWYVNGRIVHDSRLLTFVGAEVPDLLKAAYSFGGLSRIQQAKPYVDNWLKTRQSVADITSAFSQMVLKTDMAQVLNGGGGDDLYARVDMFNATRDNRGTMVLDKDTEEFANVSAPIAGLHDLQAQALEFTAAVARIPLSIYLQITPTGLNASSEGETRSFYADVKAYQERVFRPNFSRLLDVVCLSLYGQTAGQLGITFDFPDLWEMSDVEKATIRKTDADTAVTYVNAGILGPDEERERLSEDDQGHYVGIDTGRDVVEENDQRDVDKQDALAPDDPTGAHDAWNESDHPRDPIGRFGNSGNQIHQSAEEMADQFRQRGHSVRVSHSVNRNGDSSSYLEVSGFSQRLRISDHFSGNTDAFSVTTQNVDKLLEMNSQAKAEAEKLRQAETDRVEPFYQRWLNATENKKQIVWGAYPGFRDNNYETENVIRRWKARMRADA